ncbi:MAG: NADH-quinone oxidoreductase subunit J [Terracidiphilus sp.]
MTNLMEIAFFAAGAVAVIATVLAITRLVAVHALLYLIVSLLAVAVVFYTMGAPLVAALEVIIYAGAIVVLFVFVVMMLNLGAQARETERMWLAGRAWIGPVILSSLLLAEVIYLIVRAPVSAAISSISTPKQIGLALYGPYLLGVELASMLLLGALVGACHLGRTSKSGREARQ